MITLTLFIFCLLLMGAVIYWIFTGFLPLYQRRRNIRNEGNCAKARIVECQRMEVGEEPNMRVFYRHYFEFQSTTGESWRISPEAEQTVMFQKDFEFTVYYMKDNPGDYFIKELPPYQLRLLPLAIIVLVFSIYEIVSFIH